MNIDEINEGLEINDFCCTGYKWKVVLIIPDVTDYLYSAVWGRCQNPDCSIYDKNIGTNDNWRGVTHLDVDDLLNMVNHGEKLNNE